MNYKHILINSRHLVEMIVTGSVFKKVKNWPAYLTDYIGLSQGSSYIVRLRNGAKVKIRSNTTDRWSIHEVIVRDDYQFDRMGDNARTIIDLGTAEGAFAIYVGKEMKKSRIIALEPDKSNFELARENIRLNRLQKRIKLLRYAATGKDGTASLFASSDRRAHSIVKATGSSTRVRTISLGRLMSSYKVKRCDFLKMDIEGSEYELINSLPSHVLKKVKIISMEYHNLDTKKKNGASLAKFLTNNGFTVKYTDTIDHSVGQLFATRSN